MYNDIHQNWAHRPPLFTVAPVEALPARDGSPSPTLAAWNGDTVTLYVPTRHLGREPTPAYLRLDIPTASLSDPSLPLMLKQVGCDVSIPTLQSLPAPDDSTEYTHRVRRHFALACRKLAGQALSPEDTKFAANLPTREGVAAILRGADREFVRMSEMLGEMQ